MGQPHKCWTLLLWLYFFSFFPIFHYNPLFYKSLYPTLVNAPQAQNVEIITIIRNIKLPFTFAPHFSIPALLFPNKQHPEIKGLKIDNATRCTTLEPSGKPYATTQNR